MGTARSGSTILEILLANNPSILGAGEISHLFQDGFVDNKPCSCGTTIDSCLQWQPVYKAFVDKKPYWENYIELFQKIEWHKGFFKTWLNLHGKKTQEHFKELNEGIFEALIANQHIDWIIDSSKYAGRALALEKNYHDELWVICLTRSPKGVFSSFRKPNKGEQEPKSTLATSFYLLYTSTCLWIAAKVLGKRCIKISYENLLENPVRELERIEDWSGLNLSHTKEILGRNGEFEVGHIVTGNRMRKKKQIKFQPKDIVTELPSIGVRLAERFVTGWYRLLGF